MTYPNFLFVKEESTETPGIFTTPTSPTTPSMPRDLFEDVEDLMDPSDKQTVFTWAQPLFPTFQEEEPSSPTSFTTRQSVHTTMETREFNWAPLFAEMTLRKISRLRGGVFQRGIRDQVQFILVLVVTTLLSILLIISQVQTPEVVLSHSLGIVTNVLIGIILVPLVILTRVRFAALLELCLAWIFLTIIILLFIDIGCSSIMVDIVEDIVENQGGDPSAPGNSPQWQPLASYYYSTCIPATITVVTLGIVAAVGTLLLYLWNYFIIPWIIKNNTNEAFFRKWFGVTPVPNLTNTFSYKASETSSFSFLPLVRHRIRYFTYRGELDRENKPDGYGTWIDASPNGETLAGWFQNGLPSSPWKSYERATSNAFISIRIGIVRSCSDGKTNVPPDWKVKCEHRDPMGLSWSLGMAESSVSGRFFSHLPKSTQLAPFVHSSLQPDIVSCILRDSVIGVKKFDEAPFSELVKRDCIIYIHGWRQSCSTAVRLFGQLASFLNLQPTKFALFVYDWPSGGLMTFRQSQIYASSEDSRMDMENVISTLYRVGFRKFHLISHSMGARVASNLGLDEGKSLEPYFNPVDSVKHPAKASLETCIFFSPEVELSSFIHERFSGLRRYCPTITLYTDRSDFALEISEYVRGEGEEMLGKHPRKLYIDVPSTTQPSTLPDLALESNPLGTLKPRPSATFKRSTPMPTPEQELGLTDTIVDAESSLALRRRYLDVDVIDNTHLDANIPFLRHSYFLWNRLMVDDLYDLLTEQDKRRASQRARLRRRGGNYYLFSVAPKYVKG